MNYNRVVLVGRIGRDPEEWGLPLGGRAAAMNIAYTHWTGNSESGGKKTDWHRVVATGRVAEVIIEKCRKGHLVLVEGKLVKRVFQSNGRTVYVTEIAAGSVQLLEKIRKDGAAVDGEHFPDGEYPA